MGTEIFIVDPENEYERMCDAVGGAYVRLSLNSTTRINPFDLPKVVDTEEADNALRSNLVTLHGLLRLMMGGAQAQMLGGAQALMPALSPVEEADLDQERFVDLFQGVLLFGQCSRQRIQTDWPAIVFFDDRAQ